MEAPRTLFITGGSSGIGAGLARAYHSRGAKVVVTGREAAALARLARECPGLETEVLDVRDPEAVAACMRAVTARHPALDTVINNAGIQRVIDFAAGDTPVPPAEIDAEIDTNLRGMVYVAAAFLPHLRRQPTARLVQVTSGLAFVPLVRAPIYSATKAAARAFTICLREQLRDSNVRVIELIPPLVESGLHRGQAQPPPRAMKLDAFVAQAMRLLDSDREELPVGLAKVLRVAARVAPRFFLRKINQAR